MLKWTLLVILYLRFLKGILLNILQFYLVNVFFNTANDAPEPWGLFFQDNATPQMEGLEELHNNIMFYLAIVLFAVSWMMLSIIINYNYNKKNKNVFT